MPFLLKRLLFRLHWILGLSAGTVLVVVGVTGGLIGFEKPLLDLVNPQLRISAPATASPLPPDTLIAAAQAAWPQRQPRSLSWQGDHEAVIVNMAQPGQRRGGLRIAVDPYTGAVLGPLHGTGFFHVVEDLHRRLAAGRVGKQIVGASTAALILLALTGLVLRWPKHMRSLRAWLKLDFRLRGRNLLWHLHAIFGTWLLAFYLLAALTGLWWSYDFYRNALNDMAGVTGSLRPRAPPAGDPKAPLLPTDAAWSEFRQLVPGATRATLSLTRRPGMPLRLRYQTPQSAHERAWNTLHLDATSGAILSRQDYADLPRGRRFIGALYPLHAGSFFGKTGLYLMSLASLLMPLFFITGVWLWWQRRYKAARARRERLPAGAGPDAAGETILVLHASQSGTAEGLAWRTAGWLRWAGTAPRVLALDGSGAAALNAHIGHALFVVASYGDGGPPDSALDFVRRCMRGDATPDLSRLRCAVLALGNRRYETFCGFGRKLSLWLRQRGAHLLFAPVEMHEADTAALAHWRRQLDRHWRVADAGDGEFPATGREAPFTVWPLSKRRRLNLEAEAAPLFELDFALPDRSMTWQPGDLLDVRIAPSPDRIDAWLRLWNLDADTPVRQAGDELSLRQALVRCEPPRDPVAWTGYDAQTLVRELPALTARSYSIASVPTDGFVRILVRRTHDTDGLAGLASGRLSNAVSGAIAVTARLHPCPHFHAPPMDAPVLFVANGVGIAPFLGMLQQRAANATRAPAWLVYGERHPQHDDHALGRLRRWQAEGVLAELDVCFSRAGEGYVQDRLRTRASYLRAWLPRGAHVMVCGSPAMGHGVQAVLEDVLGIAAVESLCSQGRYRRELF